MADITQLVEYYANLLIIQYNGLPKAKASVELIAETILGNGLIIDVQNAYDIDTAMGVQLDVVGKYQGINRFFSEIDLINYFAMVPYSEYLSLPDSPPAWGFSTYSNFDDYSYNGTLTYEDVITSQNALSDSIFRTLIKLAVITNNCNYSRGQIDTLIWNLFGAMVRPESSGNMTMQYFVMGAVTTLIQAIITKNLFPVPMGVLLQIVTDITGDMFSFADYSDHESPFGYGFSTYANYDTLPGQVLSYSQIS